MADENTETNVETTSENEGLVRHKNELLNELKAERAKVAKFMAEQEERDAEAARKKGDYETLLKKEQDKVAKSLKERDDALAAANARMTGLLTDNAIRDVIGSYDVKPTLRPALINHLKNMIALEGDVATFNGKSADDFGKDYFASEEGREWLRPLINSGGGSTGNTGTTPQTPDVWNLSKYADMKREDPALAAAYAKKHNKNF